MILGTVGTHTAPFDRLVRALDELAGATDETVIVQRGASTVIPTRATSFTFCDSEEMVNLLTDARVVVCHAADVILDALRLGRPIIAVPRRAIYGEHLNDHQVDFARALAERGIIHLVLEPTDLASAIRVAVDIKVPPVPTDPPLARAIRRQLLEWYPDVQEPIADK